MNINTQKMQNQQKEPQNTDENDIGEQKDSNQTHKNNIKVKRSHKKMMLSQQKVPKNLHNMCKRYLQKTK